MHSSMQTVLELLICFTNVDPAAGEGLSISPLFTSAAPSESLHTKVEISDHASTPISLLAPDLQNYRYHVCIHCMQLPRAC